ncbi:MAG: type II secretion system F family protein [Steroidobacteraceae bacterium]
MEELASSMLNSASGQFVFASLVGLAVFVFGYSLSLILEGFSDPLKKRVTRLAAQHVDSAAKRRAERVSKVLKPLADYVLPKQEWEKSQTQRRLVHAGYRSSQALTVFYASRVFLLVLLPLVVVVASRWVPEWSNREMVIYAAVAGAIGLFLPSYILDRMVQKRQRAIRVGFPDALDLLVVCVESGLGLAQAIQRVARELEVSHRELAEELALVSVETRAGVERADALRNFAERTGLEDIRGLVALLVQTMRFGTSVADALRVYSEEFRDKRMQAAEELAAKVGTKMIFPLVVCLFPSFFLVAIGPAVLRMIDGFGMMAR